MFQKILIFRNLIDNIPKNIGLYMIGVLLLVANHFSIDYAKITLGLIVFLVSYSSIYIMNDLFDIDEDLITEDKVSRKPIAQGIVTKNEACLIFVILLAIGITLSFLLNSIFFVVICALVFINILYSVPPMRLKHSVFGLPLVLIMQILKILLPWTVSLDLNHFPTLFVLSFSIIYLIIFVGYKQNKTIGASIKEEPGLVVISMLVLISSISLHSSPVLQVSIMCYLFAGIIYFRDVHLTDAKIIRQSPIYVFLGVILFVFLIVYV